MGLDLAAPDHTTLSRRGQHLDVRLRRVPTGEPIHLIVDSTGLAIVGEGEWAAAKHGGKGKRGWNKLHLGVDGSGAIVARVLTDGNADDAKTGLALIEAVDGDIASVTADAAYDTIAIYEAADARGAKVVVPPTRTATVSRRGKRSAARDRTIRRAKKVGRRQWKKESGYHRQGTVENAFFRYKSIIGDRLRARHPRAQEAEALVGCSTLNRMFELGRPASVAIGRWNRGPGGVFPLLRSMHQRPESRRHDARPRLDRHRSGLAGLGLVLEQPGLGGADTLIPTPRPTP